MAAGDSPCRLARTLARHLPSSSFSMGKPRWAHWRGVAAEGMPMLALQQNVAADVGLWSRLGNSKWQLLLKGNDVKSANAAPAFVFDTVSLLWRH